MQVPSAGFGCEQSLRAVNLDAADLTLESTVPSFGIMPASHSVISVSVSAQIKRWVHDYADTHGVKKSALVESALRHHLQALQDLPADVIIPPLLVVSRSSGERILARIAKPPRPTAAMKALFSSGRGIPPRNGKR